MITRAVLTKNKKAYVVGGDTYQRRNALDRIEEIDLFLPTPSWRVLSQRLNTLVLVEKRFVVAMGVYNDSGAVSCVDYLDLEEEPTTMASFAINEDCPLL